MKENLPDSLHKIIRNNVFLATRNFNQQVRSFVKHVILDKKAPMKVQFYTYRVEFQNRGVGHIHGVL